MAFSKRGFFLITFFIATFSFSARAEYRAYLLTITNAQTGQSRVVTTILDHLQYPGYYRVSRDETVALTDTWMCWGRQGNFEPICPNPRAGNQAPSTSSVPANPAAPPAR